MKPKQNSDISHFFIPFKPLKVVKTNDLHYSLFYQLKKVVLQEPQVGFASVSSSL